MFGLGVTEMVVIGIIGVLLFGTRLPKLARSFGSSIVEFKKGLKFGVDEIDEVKGQFKQAQSTLTREASDAAGHLNRSTAEIKGNVDHALGRDTVRG